jgi:hypothetical protein
MGVTAFPQPTNYPQGPGGITKSKQSMPDWVGTAVGGTFLAGGLLLLSGRKKAGLVVTAGAMALTLFDQKETVRQWWGALPGYLDHAQRLLDQAGHAIEDLAAKRDKLRGMFNR